MIILSFSETPIKGGNKIEISNSNISLNENFTIINNQLPDGDVEETDDIEIGNVKLLEDVNYMYILKNKIEEYITYTKMEEKSALLGVLADEYKTQKEFVYIKDLDEYPSINYQNIAINKVMKIEPNTDISFYIVEGFLYADGDFDNIEEIKIGIKLDFCNQLYEIYPYEYLKEKEFLNIEIGDNLNVSDKYIAKNGNNSFAYKIVGDTEISKILMETIKIKVNFWSNEGLGLNEIINKNVGIDSTEELIRINEYEISESTRKKVGKKIKYICETSKGEIILEQKEGIEYKIIN